MAGTWTLLPVSGAGRWQDQGGVATWPVLGRMTMEASRRLGAQVRHGGNRDPGRDKERRQGTAAHPRPRKLGGLESHVCQSTSVGHCAKMAKVNLPLSLEGSGHRAEIQLIYRAQKELLLWTHLRFRPAP